MKLDVEARNGARIVEVSGELERAVNRCSRMMDAGVSAPRRGGSLQRVQDADHTFSVTSTPDNGVYVVAVAGQADLHTAPELRTAISSALDGGTLNLVIDLSETTFIDSMMLGVLLGALKRLKPTGQLTIACPDPHLRRVFEITSLDRVLDLADSREEAVARHTVRGSAT